MAISLANVIRDARDKHPAFTPKAHPDSLCVRALSLYQDELMGEAQRVRRSLLSSSYTVAMPLADHEAGITTVPAHDYIQGITGHMEGNVTFPVALVPWENRYQPGVFPAATYQGGVLRLLGKAEDWTGCTQVVVSYWPATAALVTLASVPALPDSAHGVLVEALAHAMATREAGMGNAAVALPVFEQARAKAEARWLEKMLQQNRATTTYVREVW